VKVTVSGQESGPGGYNCPPPRGGAEDVKRTESVENLAGGSTPPTPLNSHPNFNVKWRNGLSRSAHEAYSSQDRYYFRHKFVLKIATTGTTHLSMTNLMRALDVLIHVGSNSEMDLPLYRVEYDISLRSSRIREAQ